MSKITINAATKIVGIIGYPIGHSFSPLMQNAAFAAQNLNYAYIPLPVPPGDLAKAIDGLRAVGLAGANITVPHKVAAKELLDDIDNSVRQVGAVNTIVIKDNKCIGYNTDLAGFIHTLQINKVDIAGKKIVILGAGGAARAVIAGLAAGQAAEIIIVARQTEKASALAGLFQAACPTRAVSFTGQDFVQALPNCSLLVNCTPVGMYPQTSQSLSIDWDRLHPAAVVCDLIYNPRVTRFLAAAEQHNHKIINGELMLVEQGAAAFKLWTGQEAPREVMLTALRTAIKTN